MTLLEWCAKWRITPEALKDLVTTCVHLGTYEYDEKETLEGEVQRELRLEAARQGKYLFRNNRGAGRMESGNYVRYGLANDSKKLGDTLKAADLVGLETIFVTMEMVLEAVSQGLPGYKVGRFLSVEVKRPSWKFSGSLEDMAQLKWATFVNDTGGRAIITNCAGVL
jgi:hypothetical protein